MLRSKLPGKFKLVNVNVIVSIACIAMAKPKQSNLSFFKKFTFVDNP